MIDRLLNEYNQQQQRIRRQSGEEKRPKDEVVL